MKDAYLTRSGTPGSSLEQLIGKPAPKPKRFEDFLLGSETTSLTQLEQKGKAVPVVSVLFEGLARVSGVDADPKAVVQIARAFVDDLPGYPLEDVILFLRKVSRGEFGKLYGRLSLPDLMDMWRQYDAQRLEFLRANHERRKADMGGESTTGGLGTFHSPRRREDKDNTPRPKQSLEWVLTELYGIPSERVKDILEKKEG